MSPRRANPELARQRREALVRAGYAEILEKGVEGATIDSVVQRAGSSKGGALYYFRTKDDLLYAVFEWLLGQLEHTLDEIATSSDPPRARVAAEIEVLFHSAEVNRKLYVVFFDFAALSFRHERFRQLLLAFFDKGVKRDARVIQEGIDQQQFRALKAEDAARTLRALVDGFCLQWMAASPGEDLDAYRDRCRAVLGSYLLR